MGECRHRRPECQCIDNVEQGYVVPIKSQPLSSGRWDADGAWNDSVWKEREKAFMWAKGLSLKNLHWAVTTMASDTNAFTLYERKAILEVIALRLGREIEYDY